MVDDDSQLTSWFDSIRRELGTAYLKSDNPWKQSGWNSTPERWRLAREVILRAVNRSGAFLDVGCANGLLLESLVVWAGERGRSIEPHGIDLVPELIALAQKRHPAHASNFAAANAFTWNPPRRYDYVHLLLESAPIGTHREYLVRYLELAVASRGRLMVSNYASRSRHEGCIDVASYLASLGFAVAGDAFAAESDGFVLTRTAWIEKT